MTNAAANPRLEAVYETVGYADLFDMPIDLDRLHRYLVGQSLSLLETSMAVDTLVERGRLGRRDDLIYLADRAVVLDAYDERSARTAATWPEAEKWGRRVGQLPFVRMVAITGGLAALDTVGAHDDIDFFVVVRPRRLWMTRLMIMALSRIAARKDITLRPNFIVSTRSLQMDKPSLGLARKLAQMIVIVGDDLCQSVRRSNEWMFDFFPNATVEGDQSHVVDLDPSRSKRAMEWILLLPPFALLERWERNREIAKLATRPARREPADVPDQPVFSRDICAVGDGLYLDPARR